MPFTFHLLTSGIVNAERSTGTKTDNKNQCMLVLENEFENPNFILYDIAGEKARDGKGWKKRGTRRRHSCGFNRRNSA